MVTQSQPGIVSSMYAPTLCFEQTEPEAKHLRSNMRDVNFKKPTDEFFKTFAGLNPNIHRNGNVLLTGRELNASGRQGVTLVCAQVVRRQGVNQAKGI